MKRKSLLSLMLLCLAFFGVARADVVEVGTQTTTSSYLPSYSLYNYSLTQQIYTPCEIGTAGTINSIAFKSTGSEKTRSLDVYFVHTDKAAFDNGKDWITVTAADLVFSGSVTFPDNNWVTLTLPTPFVFNGVQNLAIIVDDNSGTWSSGMSCAVFNATGKALRVYSDGTNYDPMAPSSYSGTVMNVKNYLRMDITPDPSVVMCCPVQNLQATEVEAYSAKLTWNSDATDFVVEYKKSTDTVWSPATPNGNEAVLGTLTPKTTYNARVSVDCGGGDQSTWETVTFTTLPSCLVPTNFGQSELTNHSVKLKWTSDASEWEVMYIATATSDTTIVPVTENPYTLDRLSAETAYKARVRANCGSQDGLSDWTSFTSFTTLGACPAPNNLKCDASTTSTATLSWFERGDASEWEVMYINPATHDTATLTVTSNPYTITGLASGTGYTAKVRPTCAADAWSGSVTFYTAFPIPMVEAFTSSSAPAGWNRYTGLLNEVLAGTATLSSTTSGWNFTSNGVLDGYHAKGNIYGPSWKYWLVTPTVLMENNVELRFDLALTDYGNTDPIEDPTLQADDRFVVLISVNGGNWTILREWNDAGSPYVYSSISSTGEEIIYDLSSYAGQYVNIAFYGESTVSGGDNDMHIDNVSINYIPSCEKPTGLTAEIDPRDATHAYLSWTPGGNETQWVVTYMTATDTVVGNPINTNDHYELTGLTPETNYTAMVQAYCGPGDLSGYSNSVNFQPSTAIVIGQNDKTSGYLPANLYYYNSLTQQIYTAAELGEGGIISRLDFYCNGTDTYAREIDIYMVETAKDTLDSSTDWITITSADLVYHNDSVIFTQGWNDFNLNSNPFVYMGTSNVAIIVDAHSPNGYTSGINFASYEASNQAIYCYADGTDFDPMNPPTSGSNLNLSNVKNQIRIVKSELPDCMPPTNLTVTYDGGDRAQVEWTSDATAWNLKVNDSLVPGPVTNPYPLTGLDYATTYVIEVQNVCDDSESLWVSTEFTTDLCAASDMCEITLNLYDSYGDGWNGAAVAVYDYYAEELLASYTLPSGASGTATISVCDGRLLAFAWSAGSYDGECSFEVIDAVGDVVISQSGDFDGLLGYTVNCNSTCRTPINFEVANISGHSAELSWTELGEATTWIFAYMADEDEDITYDTITANPYTLTHLRPETIYYAMVKADCEEEKWSEVIIFTTDVACPKPVVSVEPTPVNAVVTWTGYGESYDLEWAEAPATRDGGVLLQYDNGSYATSIGSSTSGTRTWGVMYPAGMLEGNKTLTKVYMEESSYFSGDYTINIYSGGDDAPETLVGTETVTPGGTLALVEITLTTPVSIDPSQNLWITVTATGTYVMSASANQYTMPVYQVNNPNNQWWLQGGAWSNMGEDNSNLAEYGWMIRGFVEGYDETDFNWNQEPDLTSGEFPIDPLESSTNYVVRVKSDCGDDGESAWAWVWFTTPSACDAPDELESEVDGTNVALNWHGWLTSYNVRYRKTGDILFYEGFEEGIPADWTAVDGDGDGENWMAVSELGEHYAYYLDGDNASFIYEGEDAALSASAYNNVGGGYTSLDANNWLITPQIDLGGTLMFQAWAVGNYGDAFEVLVSTTTADTTAFTSVQELTGASGQGYDVVTVDLSAYDGQQGYIAIRHNASDGYFLVIDNFGLYVEVNGTWTDATATTANPGDIAELNFTAEAMSCYEWQVQGVNAECDGGVTDWSEIKNFVTYQPTTLTQTVQLATGSNWFSTYLEIELEDLQNALAAATPSKSITIKSPSGNSVYVPRTHAWNTNAQFVWDVAKMYYIVMAEDCEITLEDELIDPAAHPITVLGAGSTNWIGFPFSQSMTLTEAFAGFATNGDKIKSSSQNNTYNRGRWQNGNFPNLEPGQGYLYISPVGAGDRTLVYPSGSKAAKDSVEAMPMGTVNAIMKAQSSATVEVKAHITRSARENAKDMLLNIKNNKK